MSSIDDAAEWVEAASQSSKQSSNKSSQRPHSSHDHESPFKDEDDEVTPGQLTQYSLYGRGFKPTTATVGSLPAGVYEIEADDHGVYCVPMPPPSGLLLELPEMRSEEVIKQINRFWDSEKDYKDGNEFVVGGAQFKAGVMIYGPPGSGKSSTIKLVTQKMIEKGGTVFYSNLHPSPTAGFLSSFATIERNRKCIVILEDIDSLIEQYSESGYLEMLDSAKTIDNVLFIATTNYPDRLDPRIYNRPGRFSHVIKIGLPTKAAREAFLKAILKNHKDVPYIVDNSSGFTVDHLSALINSVYREGKDLEHEIKRLRTLFNAPKTEERTMGLGIGASFGSDE
jgi:Cdc6-like AAA superfamily ATPase